MDPEEEPLEPLTWHTERKPLGDMIEWDKNPRKLTAKQADDLRASLGKFDYVEPIVVDYDGKTIIGGHQRRRVMLHRMLVDESAVVDVRMPNRPLTDGEREELAIRLNKNQGEWDFDMLANEFEADKLLDWGFEAKEFSMTAADQPRGGAITESNICPECKRPL